MMKNIYTDFWVRFYALFLDFLFLAPLTYLSYYLIGLGKNVYFYTFIPNFLFGLWYHIYLTKKYGGTPGKIIAGVTIIKLDGTIIGWKEAILRNIVVIGFSLIHMGIMINSVLQINETIYINKGWNERGLYIMSLSSIYFNIYICIMYVWYFIEFIVMLMNKRKRAIHDFIAGTVAVKTKYIDNVRVFMMNKIGKSEHNNPEILDSILD